MSLGSVSGTTLGSLCISALGMSLGSVSGATLGLLCILALGSTLELTYKII